MGRTVNCEDTTIKNSEYIRIFSDYQNKINVINFANKKLIFKLKEFGKKPPAEESVDQQTPIIPAVEGVGSPADKKEAIDDNSDNFVTEYEKIRYISNFYELRLHLEAKLSEFGKCAITINVDNDGNLYHNLATINSMYVDMIGEPIKISLNVDEWINGGSRYYLYEDYDLKDKSIKRQVMSSGSVVSAKYCPYPFKEKDSFSDLDFIPVQVFKNNWLSLSDYAGLENLMTKAGSLYDLIDTYAKMTLPRIVYKSFLNSSTEAEDIEEQFVGTPDKIKVFIDLQDSDTEIQNPFQTLTPSNNIDKHINAVKELLQFINRFAMTKKEVTDKGTVQQSTGEIGEMNSIPELYQFVKEQIRLKNYGSLATKTNKFMIAYTDFTGNEEAVYEAEFEKMDKKDSKPMPMNPFQIGNQNGLVDPKDAPGANDGESK